jgi:hypothetical protein
MKTVENIFFIVAIVAVGAAVAYYASQQMQANEATAANTAQYNDLMQSYADAAVLQQLTTLSTAPTSATPTATNQVTTSG